MQQFFISLKPEICNNNGSLTLVPKVAHPSNVKEPIACCTVLYKLISKILTKRLALVVGEVFNYAQAGFIPDKHIADNILLATELINAYTHRGKLSILGDNPINDISVS